MYYDHVLHLVLSCPILSQYLMSTSYDIKKPRVEVIAILNVGFYLLVVRLFFLYLFIFPLADQHRHHQHLVTALVSMFFVLSIPSPFPFPSPHNPTHSPVLVKEFLSQAILHFEEDVIG